MKVGERKCENGEDETGSWGGGIWELGIENVKLERMKVEIGERESGSCGGGNGLGIKMVLLLPLLSDGWPQAWRVGSGRAARATGRRAASPAGPARRDRRA